MLAKTRSHHHAPLLAFAVAVTMALSACGSTVGSQGSSQPSVDDGPSGSVIRDPDNPYWSGHVPAEPASHPQQVTGLR